jgi:precorrin-2 methylase
MTDCVVVSGVISPTSCAAAIGAEVWIDQHCVINCEHVDSAISFEHTLDDSDGEHELRIVMKHKQAAHTQLDEQGNIVQDAVLTVADLEFDGINIMQISTERAEYSHDFNGSQPAGVHRFYGDMGCNGTVSLKFTTPVYLWLLENM